MKRTTQRPATSVWHVFGRVCAYAVRKGAIPTSPLDRTEIDDGRDGDDDGSPRTR